jgi:hypothetical protein
VTVLAVSTPTQRLAQHGSAQRPLSEPKGPRAALGLGLLLVANSVGSSGGTAESNSGTAEGSRAEEFGARRTTAALGAAGSGAVAIGARRGRTVGRRGLASADAGAGELAGELVEEDAGFAAAIDAAAGGVGRGGAWGCVWVGIGALVRIGVFGETGRRRVVWISRGRGRAAGLAVGLALGGRGG